MVMILTGASPTLSLSSREYLNALRTHFGPNIQGSTAKLEVQSHKIVPIQVAPDAA
jgi:hypothetical protein